MKTYKNTEWWRFAIFIIGFMVFMILIGMGIMALINFYQGRDKELWWFTDILTFILNVGSFFLIGVLVSIMTIGIFE